MTRRSKISKRKRAVVLLSGGLDSTVSLYWAQKNGYQCYALSFDYGQRHKKELKIAARIAAGAGIKFRVVQFSLPWGGSSLTDKNLKIPTHRLKNMSRGLIPSTYVPARNTVFLSLALSWADYLTADSIVIGANAVDYSGYPDCRPIYLEAFENVANLGTRTGTEVKKRIKILAPLVKLTKAEIIKLGQKLNAPIRKTWSCYKGGIHPCGICDSCKLRNKGFKEVQDQ